MKVLQVITSLRTGGAEKLVVEMAPIYKQLGVQVDVLLFDGVDTPLKQELLDLGFNVYELARGKSVYNPRHITRLRAFFREYDIVHSHNAACQYFTAFARLLYKGQTKFVTTEHSTNNKRRDVWWIRQVERFVYKRYDSIIAISQIATDNLKRHLNTTKDILTINNGVDLSKYVTQEPLDREHIIEVDNDVILITQVAGFREAKDQDTVIRSLKNLPANIHIAFVGDGARQEICEFLAEEMGVSDRVHFLGLRSDVPKILKCSDIVVMSSHWEGLSLSSVEGMASGRPMVASDVQGLREVVGGAGILFKEGDDKALANEIVKLLSDKSYYNEISMSCLQRASKYDINIMVEKYYREYLKLVNLE